MRAIPKQKGANRLKTPIQKQEDIMLFVLHLIRRIERPMTYLQLNEIIEVTEHIQYIDFAETFHKMLEEGYLDPVGKGVGDDDELYFISARGIAFTETRKSEFREAIIGESTTAADRYLRFSKDEGLTCDCSVERLEADKSFNVTFRIFNRDKVVLSGTINAKTEEQARRMIRNIYANPDVVYTGMNALLRGDVNYIWGVQDPKKAREKADGPAE